MKKLLYHIPVFMIGGLLYMLVEILWRGHTHWTMFLLGGGCFVLIGLLDEWLIYKPPLIVQMLMGAVIITALELVVGLIVNVWLGWNVWDYSTVPGNVLGQICPQFTVAWFFLSGVAIWTENRLHDIIDWMTERKTEWNK